MRMLPLVVLTACFRAIASGPAHHEAAAPPAAHHEPAPAHDPHAARERSAQSQADSASKRAGLRDPAPAKPAHRDSASSGPGQRASAVPAPAHKAPAAAPHAAGRGSVATPPDHHGSSIPAHGPTEAAAARGRPESPPATGPRVPAPVASGHGESDKAASPHGGPAAPAPLAHEGEEERKPAKSKPVRPAASEAGHAETAQASGEERESGETPSLQPRPDTIFARASDWDHGEAEILEYAVKRVGRDGEGEFRGRLLTERLFLRADGTATRERAGGAEEILNASLSATGEMGGIPYATETVSQFPRAGRFALLRQEQSLQGWPGVTHRSLDARVTPPRLRVSSSGGEAPRDTALARWPVYTQEMLFTYLRAIPLKAGYREEVWLHDWGEEGRLAPKPRYAAIAVRERAPGIKDMDTWYVTVDRDQGPRSEFWVGATGLHPVVVARLSDGSEWTLRGITRRKYRSW